VVSVVTVTTAALLAAGAVVALIAPALLVGDPASLGKSRVFEDYTVSRDAALAVFLLAPLLRRALPLLRSALLLVVGVQLFDAAFDVAGRRWAIAPIAIVLAIACFLSAQRLRRPPSA
jgi:hypothetical protein